MITLTCTKKEVIALIEQYYQEKEGRKVKVSIRSKKECIGLYEKEGCVTTIKIKETMELLGMKKEVETILTKEELQDIFHVLLADQGYIVTSLTYNDGLTSSWEGYYMSERLVKKVYFNGITIGIENKKERPFMKERHLNR